MRPTPSAVVETWVRAQNRAELYTTAITVADIGFGLGRLPAGRRKQELEAAADEVFSDFADQVLSFNVAAAGLFGAIVSGRERAGAPIEGFDAQIASICQVHGAPLATRNVKDFEAQALS
jgi:predicted nucleic acid-binding protein